MKTFYGSIFIKREKLDEAGIKYPIKLEYYKIINEDEFVKENKAKYGIQIVKTEYLEDDVKIEERTLKYLSNDEEKINDLLEILKRNEVTPICIEDVVIDFSKTLVYL